VAPPRLHRVEFQGIGGSHSISMLVRRPAASFLAAERCTLQRSQQITSGRKWRRSCFTKSTTASVRIFSS
jgi:hypothetical protein